MPFDVYNRLTEAFGEDQVFIVESLSGPKKDTRSAVVGFNKLLTVEARRHRVTIAGSGVAADRAREVARGGYSEDDGAFRLPALSDVWDLLRRVQGCFRVDGVASPAVFGFGFFGYFGYDTAHFVEELPYIIPPSNDAPDISLSIFQGVVRYDLAAGTSEIVIARSAAWEEISPAAIMALIETCPSAAEETPPPVPAPFRVSDSTTKDIYLRDVETALGYIGIGDIYQVQIGHELSIETAATPREVYSRLRARNPAPYMYLARFGEVAVIGASQRCSCGSRTELVTMRPLAGTVPRSVIRRLTESAETRFWPIRRRWRSISCWLISAATISAGSASRGPWTWTF